MGLMTDNAIKPDDLDALIRACGGLRGLAAQLGPHDLAAKLYEPVANEKKPRERVGLWRRIAKRSRETLAAKFGLVVARFRRRGDRIALGAWWLS
jgi:hypothetical protein